MKDVPGFEGRYAVTEDGRIWSFLSNRFLKASPNRNGYPCVELCFGPRKKKRYSRLLHRLVASAYLENPKNLPEVNHKNNEKLDARVENLEWVTPKENGQHQVKTGRSLRGEKSPVHKLTQKEVDEIRGKYKFHKYTAQMLAKEYNVYPTTIYAIVTWRHWKNN